MAAQVLAAECSTLVSWSSCENRGQEGCEAARRESSHERIVSANGHARAAEVRALAAQALQECEHAQPFCARVLVVEPWEASVLPRPSVSAAPTGRLRGGEVAEVIARAYIEKDGRVYLRLRSHAGGWISTRARENFSTVVVTLSGNNVDGLTLEPQGLEVASRVLPVLQQRGSAGRFRALSGCPLLSGDPRTSAGLTTTCKRLAVREEFLADVAWERPADGRVYLQLQDGRGWVCERSRSDFSHLVVEPCEPEEPGPRALKRRRRVIDWARKVESVIASRDIEC